MKIVDEKAFKRNESVVERQGEDELLLFHSMVGKLYEVNSVGKDIWELLDGRQTVGQIREEMRKQYGSIDEIDGDLHDFLRKLLELNLIT
jgi:hypothetical protein